MRAGPAHPGRAARRRHGRPSRRPRAGLRLRARGLPATSQRAPTNAVVHVVADAATLSAATTAAHTAQCSAPAAQPAPSAPAAASLGPEVSAQTPTASPTGTTAVSVAAAHTAECSAPPAVVMGGGIMPAPLLSRGPRPGQGARDPPSPGDDPPRTGVSALGRVGAVRALPRPDVSLAGLRPPRRSLRS